MAAAKRRPGTSTTQSTKRQTAAERAQRAEVRRLRRRIADLMLAYVATGKATPRLQASVRKLKSDIDGWRDRTGGRDLRATLSAQRNNTDDGWTCERCEWIMTSLGRVCFLVGCDPEWNQCSYICFRLARDPDYPVS